ncbi:DUF2993 domain-containing protein [Planktothrix sp. FACHB-1365]|uniref:LmeA family phospholipid-binding protein n=1 Tax=Planktothrix sp. FACHB-1365 TaxID=2692855 RepID=UPI0016898326|nr:DUF2993 domain-containing protein [Planktothrix sp. FACHB-1365]MBD2484680.1 DUF2993 domain-containing protein [Planktothrix sp. FACHB-1365]
MGMAMGLMQVSRKPLIGSLLSTAVQLWLRSQVDTIDRLELSIKGSNRSLLSGHIPQVSVSAEKAIYQGLHLTQVQLQGSEIRFNLAQVLKGQSLHLLEAFFVTGNLQLNESDLNASLKSPMLTEALNEFVLSLLRSMTENPVMSSSDLQPEQAYSWVNSVLQIQDTQMALETDHLVLTAKLLFDTGELLPFQLKTGLELASSYQLRFVQPQVKIHTLNTEFQFSDYIMDLGSDINIQGLILSPECLEINATLKVNP